MCQKSEQRELALEVRGEAPQGQRSGEYHIVSSTDQLEAVHKLAALHGQVVDEPRRVVAIGEADSRRTRTEPAQSGSSRGARRAQPDAPQYRRVASPTGFEHMPARGPSSETVDQARKDNELREEPDDGNRRE